MARWQYPALVEPVFFGSPPPPTDMKWFQPASTPLFRKILPVAVIASGMFAPVFTGAAPPPPTDMNWFQPASTPLFRKILPIGVVASGMVAPVSVSPETTTVDRWHQPLSRPTPAKPSLAAYLQPAYTAPVSIAPETTTVDRWHQPLSRPTPAKPGLGAHQQQALAWSPLPPATMEPSFGYFAPLSLPPRKPPALAGYSVGPVSTSPESTTLDRWHQPLSLPIWRRIMPAAEQAAFFWSGFTPAATPQINSAGWYVPLSQPYPYRRGLGVALQQAYTSYLSMDPGPAPPSTVTLDDSAFEGEWIDEWVNNTDQALVNVAGALDGTALHGPFYNPKAALRLTLNVSAIDAGSLTATLLNYDRTSGIASPVVATAALSSTGLVLLEVGPDVPAASNAIALDYAPAWFFVRVVVVSGPVNYTIGAQGIG